MAIKRSFGKSLSIGLLTSIGIVFNTKVIAQNIRISTGLELVSLYGPEHGVRGDVHVGCGGKRRRVCC